MAIEREDLELLDVPDEKLEFSKWLRKRWARFFFENNASVSKNDFARHLGISNANLTNYTTNLRRPSAEFVELLADKLGPQVYDKLDMPRRMPRDKDILFVVDSMGLFSKEERRALIEHVRNMREENERKVNEKKFA